MGGLLWIMGEGDRRNVVDMSANAFKKISNVGETDKTWMDGKSEMVSFRQ